MTRKAKAFERVLLISLPILLVLSNIDWGSNVPMYPKPRPQMNLARALYNAGRTDEAMIAYLDVINNPRAGIDNVASVVDETYRAEAIGNLGALLLDRGETSAAIGLLEMSEQVEPTPGGIANLGVAYLREGRLDAAWKLFDKYESRFPSFGPFWWNRGQLAAKLGRCDDAEKFYQHAADYDVNAHEWLQKTPRLERCTARPS